MRFQVLAEVAGREVTGQIVVMVEDRTVGWEGGMVAVIEIA
jgi:hypothetical protein